tara:strand:+ start:2756 stop:2974 length:219 start_codon:yes stop_codon:yes gene_type:complete
MTTEEIENLLIEEIGEHQYNLGINKVEETKRKFDVDEETALKILSEVSWIKIQHQWVNMDLFLNYKTIQTNL